MHGMSDRILGWTMVVLASSLAMSPCILNQYAGTDVDLFLRESPFARVDASEAVRLIVTGQAYPEHAYYPFLHLAFGADVLLLRAQPHLVFLLSLVIYTIAALLVWEIIRHVLRRLDQVSRPAQLASASLAAGMFAAHPVNVEVVAWLGGRDILLAVTLALASLLIYLRANERWWGNLFATGFFGLSVLSSANAVTTPLVLLAYYGVVSRDELRRQTIRLLPMAVIMVVGAILRSSAVATPVATTLRTPSLWLAQLPGGLEAQVRHLSKLAYPAGLYFNPEFPFRWGPASILGCVLLIASSILVIWFARSKTVARRIAAFGVAWYWLAVLPTFLHNWPGGDRHLYFGLAGLMLVVGLFAALSLTRIGARTHRIAFIAVGVLVIFLMSFVSRAQVRTWDSENYERHWNCCRFDIDRDDYDRACALVAQGNDAMAVEAFVGGAGNPEKAAGILITQAVGLCAQGNQERSILYFYKSLELAPNNQAAYLMLGMTLARIGRTSDAVVQLSRAVELAPNDRQLTPKILSVLGMLYASAGEAGLAASHLERALELNPNLADARLALGEIWCVQGNPDKARQSYREGAELARRLGDLDAMAAFQKELDSLDGRSPLSPHAPPQGDHR